MDLKLRGRNALITGASKGIGRAIATVLADEGCNLILVSRTAADLDAAKEKLVKTGVPVVTHALDLSSNASIDNSRPSIRASTSWSTMRAPFRLDALVRSRTSAGGRPGT